MASSGDKRVDEACRAAKKIKKVKQVGSYAWHVTSNKKKFRVQTDAYSHLGVLQVHSFALCDCGGYTEERTTICPHVIRVLVEIVENDDDTDE